MNNYKGDEQKFLQERMKISIQNQNQKIQEDEFISENQHRSIEQIEQLLSREMESTQTGSEADIARCFVFAKYHVNNENILYNDSFQSFTRKILSIISLRDIYENDLRKQAIILVYSILKSVNKDAISFIRELGTIDRFLDLMDANDYDLLAYYIICLRELAGFSFEVCKEIIESLFFHHSQSLEIMMANVNTIDPISDPIKIQVVKFAQILSLYPLNTEAIKFCFAVFWRFLESDETDDLFYYSMLGVRYIILSNANDEWVPMLSKVFNEKINFWVTIETLKIRTALVQVIGAWFSKGEVFEFVDKNWIVSLMNINFTPNHMTAINNLLFDVALTIQIMINFNELYINDMVDYGLLDLAIPVYFGSSFLVKENIAMIACTITVNGLLKQKQKMIELGYINLFVDAVESNDEILTREAIRSLHMLFQVGQCPDGNNICYEYFQNANGPITIAEIANSDEKENIAAEMARLLLDDFFSTHDD